MAFALFKKPSIPKAETLAVIDPTAREKELPAMSKEIKLLFNQAKNLVRDKNFNEAADVFIQVAKSTPANIQVLVSTGNTLAKAERPDEAEIYFRKVEELDKENISYLPGLASALTQQLKFEEALPYYLKAVEKLPNDHNLFLRLADVYTGLRRYKDAADTVARFLKIEKSDVNNRRMNICNQRAGVFAEHENQTRFFTCNYFTANKPNLSAVQNRIVEEALDTGIALTHIEELFDDKELKLYELAQKQVMEFRSSNIASDLIQKIKECEDFNDDPGFKEIFKPSVVNFIINSRPIKANDDMVQLFLHHKIVDIANSYNGMLSKIRNVNLWINPAIKGKNLGIRKGSQLWHRDQEDEKILKCFIYLTDVDAESGALDYVKYSKCIPERKYSELHPYPFSSGYPGNYIFKKFIDEKEIITASCRKGTIAFVDTNGFHRGGYVTKDERIVLMATYLRPTSPYVITNTRLQLKDADPTKFSMEALYALS